MLSTHTRFASLVMAPEGTPERDGRRKTRRTGRQRRGACPSADSPRPKRRLTAGERQTHRRGNGDSPCPKRRLAVAETETRLVGSVRPRHHGHEVGFVGGLGQRAVFALD